MKLWRVTVQKAATPRGAPPERHRAVYLVLAATGPAAVRVLHDTDGWLTPGTIINVQEITARVIPLAL